MMWNETKEYRRATDWADEAKELFGLPLEVQEVESALGRAVSSGSILYNAQRKDYELSVALRNATLMRMEESEKLEISAQSSWLAEVGSIVPDIPSDDMWNCLITYAGEMFLHHGYEAIALLSEGVNLTENDDDAEISFTPGEALYKALRTAGINTSNMSRIGSAIAVFFNGANSERVRYVTELADSTFNLMALGVDEDTRHNLIHHLPSLSIFIDTNVIFDIVGAHDSLLGAASIELFELIRDQPLSLFHLYCHEKTLQELERTLDGIGSWLRRTNWTPSISRSVLKASPDITSIELKYHQTNAAVPTPPDVFLSRYSSMPTLLDQYGIRIYRDPVVETPELLQERAELTAEYEAFIEKHATRKRPYEALDHDMTLWLATRRRRTRAGKGPLFSGALLLSADYMLRRFEREVLARKSSNISLVTQPGSLLQALRPFVSMSPNYDVAFVQLFSTASFRVITPGLGQTVNSVASYLATYDGLPEEIATKILTNSILMSRLSEIDRNDVEFQRIVSDAVIDESKAIIRERDQLLAEQQNSTENAREVISELSVIADNLQNAGPQNGFDDSVELAERLKRLEEKIAAGGLSNTVINVENAYGMQAGGSIQNFAINLASELPAIREFVEQFREHLDELPLSPQQLEDVNADLDAAAAQLARARPRPAILHAAVSSLREIVLGAAGSGAFAGLVELAQHIHF
jgi:hypothetical protein